MGAPTSKPKRRKRKKQRAVSFDTDMAGEFVPLPEEEYVDDGLLYEKEAHMYADELQYDDGLQYIDGETIGDSDEAPSKRSYRKHNYGSHLPKRSQDLFAEIFKHMAFPPDHHFGDLLSYTGHETDLMGAYTRETRRKIVARHLRKKKSRCYNKKVMYGIRKNFADSRVRVKGRFINKEVVESLSQYMALT